MKNITIALSAVFLAFATSLFAADVVENWTNHCAKCHAADGSGKTKIGQKMKLKDYTNAKVQADMTDEEIVKATKEGVFENGKEKMKAYTELSDEEVNALVAHIRAMKK